MDRDAWHAVGRKESDRTERLSNNNNKSAWMCKAKYLIRQAVLWVREGVKEE